jgi:hypothetical protein
MGKALETIKTELEIEEHLDSHRKGFVAQRIGLAILLGIVAAGAAGFFGDGWISNRSVTVPTAVVTFQRFHRHEAIMKLTVSVSKNDRDQITVSFPSNYLKSLEIKTITPEVSSIDLVGDRVNYIFPGKGTTGTINFSIVPLTVGNVKGQIEVNDSPVELTHFIYP